MEKKEFDRHMKEGIPFVVYPDAILWDPKKHPGEDAHEVYRELLASYRLGVNLEAVEDFKKKEPLSLIRQPSEKYPFERIQLSRDS